MTKKMKKDLIRAAELIATNKENTICDAMNSIVGFSKWKETEEAQIINPNSQGVIGYWWGYETIGFAYYSYKSRGARLIGIAMMITMPKEIVQHKCYKK
jgi:hypothetical protein